MTHHYHKDERERYNRKLCHKWNSEGLCPRLLEHPITQHGLMCLYIFRVGLTKKGHCLNERNSVVIPEVKIPFIFAIKILINSVN